MAQQAPYIAGSTVELCCAFSVGLTPTGQTATFAQGETVTYNGVLTDPTSVSLLVTNGIGQQTTYTPSKESTGLYHVDLVVGMTTAKNTELWVYSWRGAGAVAAVGEGAFVVQRSNQG